MKHKMSEFPSITKQEMVTPKAGTGIPTRIPDRRIISVNLCGDYYESSWENVLNAVQPLLLIGTDIRFVGGNNAIWRFVSRKEGGYIFENGNIDEYWSLIDQIRS